MKSVLTLVFAALALLVLVFFVNRPKPPVEVKKDSASPASQVVESSADSIATLQELRQKMYGAALEAFLEFTAFPFQPHIAVGKSEVTEPRPGTFIFDGDFNNEGQALYFAVSKASTAKKFIEHISSLHGLSYSAFRQVQPPTATPFKNPSLSILKQNNRHILLFWGLEKDTYKLAAQIQLKAFDEAEISKFKSALEQQRE